MNNDIRKYIESELKPETQLPVFQAGDNITVYYKIREGEKSRTQPYRGDVIMLRGKSDNMTSTFTVRKKSGDVFVERVFPFHSPNIEKIEVHKRGSVRRARLYYLRTAKGKAARIKEKR